jgi:hypothetical protein
MRDKSMEDARDVAAEEAGACEPQQRRGDGLPTPSLALSLFSPQASTTLALTARSAAWSMAPDSPWRRWTSSSCTEARPRTSSTSAAARRRSRCVRACRTVRSGAGVWCVLHTPAAAAAAAGDEGLYDPDVRPQRQGAPRQHLRRHHEGACGQEGQWRHSDNAAEPTSVFPFPSTCSPRRCCSATRLRRALLLPQSRCEGEIGDAVGLTHPVKSGLKFVHPPSPRSPPQVGLQVPLVVRLEGTNVEQGKRLLRESGLPIVTADDLDDAAKKAVAQVPA